MRYRVMEKSDNYYLLDTEETFWFYIIPFLTWFHKYKIYAIDEAQAQYFMKSKERQDIGRSGKFRESQIERAYSYYYGIYGANSIKRSYCERIFRHLFVMFIHLLFTL